MKRETFTRHCVYRAYDAEGRLLYVGTTGQGLKRLTQHTDGAQWWDDVACLTIEHATSRDAAIDIEFRAIEQEAPLHNQKPGWSPSQVAAARDAALARRGFGVSQT